MLIITKEHNYVKHICGVAFLFSAHRLMILYMGKHHKRFQSYEADTISIILITKGYSAE